MSHRIVSIGLMAVLCFFTLAVNSTAADKVVVIPLGANSLFKGDQYLTLSSAAFTPGSNSTEYSRGIFYFTSGYLLLSAPLNGATASVNLPDGARISQLSTYAQNSGAPFCKMYFTKHALNNKEITIISDETSTVVLATDEYAPIHVAIADEIIDNQNFQYILSWSCTGLGTSTDQLHAARIKYRLQ